MPGADRPSTLIDLDAVFADLVAAPRLLIALSGGSDSTALAVLLSRWRARCADGPVLYAATIDHGLRVASRHEAEQAAALCAALHIPHKILNWEGDKPSTGLAEAARDARYGLLAAHAREIGVTHLVTAHTGDDQIETLLMRLLRGSGLKGLGGMRGVSTQYGLSLVRPLLGVSRQCLRDELIAAGIGWVDDPSNADARYLRPRLRQVVPLLVDEGLEAQRLARSMARLQQAEDALEVMSARLLAVHARIVSTDLVIERAALLAEPMALRQRMISQMIESVGALDATLLQIEALDARICGGEARVRTTLAGALVSAGERFVRVRREDDPRRSQHILPTPEI